MVLIEVPFPFCVFRAGVSFPSKGIAEGVGGGGGGKLELSMHLAE